MFSEHLKKIRTESRYTLEAMAEKLGVKTRTYVSWEREGKIPSMELGTLLCQKLNINLNWFCTGTGEMFIDKSSDDELEAKIRAIIAKVEKEKSIK